MGLLEVLTVVFVVLKLTGHVDWSWLVVLLPLIGAFVVYFTVVALVLTVWRIK